MNESARVTFVLPGRRRSGGVLATAAMGNELLRRGYDVRIAWRDIPWLSMQGARRVLGRASTMLRPVGADDGLAAFEGRRERFRQLDELGFTRGERVIAVGSMTVDSVRRLSAPVVKLRYCHGFTPHDEALMRQAWGFPMPTIAVSEGLVGRLEALCGHKVLAVVPNGLDERLYYEEPGVTRDGVGAIYGDHASKDPGTLVELVGLMRKSLPGTPLRLFGQDRRPACLVRGEYTRMPGVDQVRRLYNRALVWVVPSRSEGFGMPILEAMACGAAVVSTCTEGAQAIIEHGRNGLLAGIGDAAGLLDCIGQLLEGEGERSRLAAQGRLTARAYRWACATDRMEECLALLEPAVSIAK